MSDSRKEIRRLRSEEWFNTPAHPDGTVIYIERFLTYGITPEEFVRIQELLGREPNYTELGIFSVMWSEHCS